MPGPEGGKRSIGEVLALLKTEYPDISISKIRFLEGQGLIAPERTASGYRKFSEEDVATLRFILREQKENFLPFKVIKSRLAERSVSVASASNGTASSGAPVGTLVESSPVSGPAVLLNREELQTATGLSEHQLKELENYGLLSGEKSGGGMFYDEAAISIAKLAAHFLNFGVEARHLRIYKTAADREADLYRQLTGTPSANSRNTSARMEMEARREQLVELGEAMRHELLRASLRRH